jgi:hypothetical protein
MTPEKRFEQAFRLAIQARRALALKLETPGFTGSTDRLVLVYPGKVWFVETKAGRNSLSARQRLVHKQLKALGMNVRVLKDYEDPQTLIDEIFAA